jgi:RNA polymerase sigma-B factor
VPDREGAERLAVAAAAGDGAATEQLVSAMGPLVAGMARRFQGRVPRADLEQAGVVGLLRAAQSFDPDRGTPFGGYAAPFVMGEMLACVRQLTAAVHVPRDVADAERAVTAAIDKLSAVEGRSPTVEEIADRTGIDEERVLEALRVRLAAHPVPLDGIDFADAAVTDQALRQVEQRLALGTRLERLDRRSRTILLLRFGLELSQREIAARLGISQMHVSRLLRAAMAALDDTPEDVSG